LCTWVCDYPGTELLWVAMTTSYSVLLFRASLIFLLYSLRTGCLTEVSLRSIVGFCIEFAYTKRLSLLGWSAPSCIATAGAGAGGQIGKSDIQFKTSSAT
jgi:hypothetical protein